MPAHLCLQGVVAGLLLRGEALVLFLRVGVCGESEVKGWCARGALDGPAVAARPLPEHLIFCPPCSAASSWSMGWLDSEKIQISATFPSSSLWLLQSARTWPPSVGCCIT